MIASSLRQRARRDVDVLVDPTADAFREAFALLADVRQAHLDEAHRGDPADPMTDECPRCAALLVHEEQLQREFDTTPGTERVR